MHLRAAIEHEVTHSSSPEDTSKRIMELVERFLHHNMSDYLSPKHITDKLQEDHLP